MRFPPFKLHIHSESNLHYSKPFHNIILSDHIISLAINRGYIIFTRTLGHKHLKQILLISSLVNYTVHFIPFHYWENYLAQKINLYDKC